MAFTIKKRESYRWTIEHALEKREGKVESVTFDAEFKALPQKKIEELMEKARGLKIDDLTFLDEILVGWHGLDDARGEQAEAFPFNRENVRALLELYPGIGASLSKGWTDSVLGWAATRKN